MARITFLAALALSLRLLSADPLHACSCGELPTIREAHSGAHDVFLGSVISITLIASESKFVEPVFGQTIRVVMAVEERWKGAFGDTIEIYTGAGADDCGYPFSGRRRYLVYTTLHEGASITTVCMRTRPAESAEDDITVLGRRDRKRITIASRVGLAGIALDKIKIGMTVGIGLSVPLDSNVALVTDVLNSWIMGAEPNPLIDPNPNNPDGASPGARFTAVCAGVRYRTGPAIYLHARGGYAWYSVEESVGVESSPAVSTGFSFEIDPEESIRPFVQIDFIASLNAITPRWGAIATGGVSFDF